MFGELIGAAAVAAITSLIICRVQMAAGPVDHADEDHKAHARPTPTSGGLGIALGFAASMAALVEFGVAVTLAQQVLSLVWLASAMALVFLLIGFIDDTRRLGPRFKFLLFTLLSFAAAITMGIVDELPLGHGQEWRLGMSLGLFGTALWVFTIVNCVNFMDGANGLAMGSVAIGLQALGTIAVLEDSASAAALCYCTAGAIAGFLVWNFPNGKIFAGDSGALFAGAVAGVASLIVLARSDLSPFVPPILFLPLLADALLTLAWRVMRRRKILVGHQEHLYQIAIRAGWSHARVSLTYWLAMTLCGVAGIWLSQRPDSPAAWVTLASLASICVLISLLVRRFAHARGLNEDQSQPAQ